MCNASCLYKLFFGVDLWLFVWAASIMSFFEFYVIFQPFRSFPKRAYLAIAGHIKAKLFELPQVSNAENLPQYNLG